MRCRPSAGSRSTFTLYDQEISVCDGRCTRADGSLAGAHLDMASAVRNCVELLGVPLTQALRFASAEPASFLGLGGFLGRIAPGYRADLVAFDPGHIQIHGTWVAGRPAAHRRHDQAAMMRSRIRLRPKCHVRVSVTRSGAFGPRQARNPHSEFTSSVDVFLPVRSHAVDLRIPCVVYDFACRSTLFIRP